MLVWPNTKPVSGLTQRATTNLLAFKARLVRTYHRNPLKTNGAGGRTRSRLTRGPEGPDKRHRVLRR
jgi:hypothetical protein